MIELTVEQLEAGLQVAASAFPYPPTPDIAGVVRRRLEARGTRPVRQPQRLAWAIALALLILGGLLAVPDVRAGLLEFLQLGAVRIRLIEPAPTVTPTAGPTRTGTPSPATATPIPTATSLASLLDLAGQTTLAEARSLVDFPIRLPAYPADLGPPDRVFVQDFGAPLVVLVWLDPDDPDQVQLSLHEFGPDSFAAEKSPAAEKSQPVVIQTTTVNGEPALWTEGPHLLRLKNGDHELRRLIEGHVLIWVEEEITYRLETDLPLEEAVRIAESLE